MAKILSQQEVDALLSEFSQEETGPTPAAEEVTIKPGKNKKEIHKDRKVSIYDFRRPDRVSRDQLRSLHYLHERFARNFSSSLSAYLRALVDVNLYSLEQFTYAEFILSLPDPTYFNVIAMDPLEGNAVLEINPKILFPMIDKILGGKGEDFGEGMRTLTDIERTLIQGAVKLILEDLEDSWKQIVKLRMSIVAAETSPQSIQVVAANEIVVLIVFELRVGEARGFMNFCIPSIMLEPIAKRFSRDWYAHRAKTSAEEVKKIKLNLLKTKMSVEAGIYDNSIRIKDLLELGPGDLVKLETKKDDEINIRLNGIKKYSAYQVKKDKKKAVQIVNLIPREFKNE
ncbi:MAG: flagellar motor switch protein FliM [Candidatus Aminicenantes bacterium]|nr:MAG: flagellar motor switch protein FliM [Candidatus Aminicenantes bacterium]